MSCSIPDPATFPHSPLEAKVLRGASLSSLPWQISAVRLPREPTNPERLKGFGYAEFEDIDSLFQALSLNEEVSPVPASQSTSWGLKGLQGPGGGFGHGPGVMGKGQMASSWKRGGSGGIWEGNSQPSTHFPLLFQSLGNRRIRVDVADQAQDKGECPAEDADQAG